METMTMDKIYELPVPGHQGASAEIDRPGSSAPLGDADGTPPVQTPLRVPHAGLSASPLEPGTAGKTRHSRQETHSEGWWLPHPEQSPSEWAALTPPPVMPEAQDLRGVRFTSQEIQQALSLRAKGMTYEEIARRIGRSSEGVRSNLREWEPTADLAKATLKRGANELAERVVKSADVDQSLEVLDRLDVLPKKEKAGMDQRVQVLVGVNLDDITPMKVAVMGQIGDGETE